MPPPEVMVVEDDANLRECVADTLSTSGFRPVVARNGREALLLLRGGRGCDQPLRTVARVTRLRLS